MSRRDAALDAISNWAHRLPDAIVVTKPELAPPGPEIVYVNEAFVALTGYPAAVAVGRTPRILQGPATSRTVLERLKADLIDRRSFFGETVNYRADGSHYIVQWSISAITGDADAVRYWVGVLRDVTDRRRAEAALKEEKEAGDRARLAAERANAATSRLVAAASHDLRQPLQTVQLLTGLLREAEGVVLRSALVDDIDAAMNRANKMLGALLNLSRFDAGAVKPDIRDFVIGTSLRRIERAHRATAVEAALALRVVPCNTVVRSDEALLDRILDHLVANAIRYTEAGRVLVGCRRRRGRLSVEVWDTGIGIAPEQQEAIFEAFYQLGKPPRDAEQGLGLGLAIVQRIAKFLGHRLSISSTPGRGSVFAVEVPFGDSETARQKVDYIDTVAAGNIRGKRVMMIEDDGEVRRSMSQLLAHWGATVAAVASMGEAATLAAREPADLVISNYRLPGVGGGIAGLRQALAHRGVAPPIIVVTGDTGDAARREMQASGCAYLYKPVSVSKLRTLMETLLRPGPGPRTSRRVVGGGPALR